LGATGHAARRRFEAIHGFEAIHDDEAAMLDGFKAMRASLEAMQQASGQSGWMAFSRLVLRAIDLPPPNNRAMARGLGEGGDGQRRIRATGFTARATC
jgi:hypothetical protein